MGYIQDREWTDNVHKEIAIPDIYDHMGWKLIPTQGKFIEHDPAWYDMHEVIDYCAVDMWGNDILIQERFRKASSCINKYTGEPYEDATLRFLREYNPNGHVNSEITKLPAAMDNHKDPFYLLYGVISDDGSKVERFTVIDLRVVNQLLSDELILLDGDKLTEVDERARIHAGINYNRDGSSSFVAIDVLALMTIFPGSVACQYGFPPIEGLEIPTYQIQLDHMYRLQFKYGMQFDLEKLAAMSYRKVVALEKMESAVRKGYIKESDFRMTMIASGLVLNPDILITPPLDAVQRIKERHRAGMKVTTSLEDAYYIGYKKMKERKSPGNNIIV